MKNFLANVDSPHKKKNVCLCVCLCLFVCVWGPDGDSNGVFMTDIVYCGFSWASVGAVNRHSVAFPCFVKLIMIILWNQTSNRPQWASSHHVSKSLLTQWFVVVQAFAHIYRLWSALEKCLTHTSEPVRHSAFALQVQSSWSKRSLSCTWTQTVLHDATVIQPPDFWWWLSCIVFCES